MDLEAFTAMRPAWAMEPCLYIVKQMAAGNTAHRCGASGTHMYNNADMPYGSSAASLTGLLGRMTMYLNYWLPVKGTIYAALRIRKQLVAEPTQRTAMDSQGNTYNVDRGNQTLVLSREKEFHAELDRRGFRWRGDRKNELFVPRTKVEELIAAMRTIRGESMYLFDSSIITEDRHYRGGTRRERVTVTETAPRAQPDRGVRVPSITVRLSKHAIDQLRSANPNHFRQLLNILREYDEERAARTVTLPRAEIDEIREETPRGRDLVRGLQQTLRRRSPRLAAQKN